MTMVARMMRTMTQISRMCLGSTTSTGTWLTASMLLHSAADRKEEITVLYPLPASPSWQETCSRSQKRGSRTSCVILKVAGPLRKLSSFTEGGPCARRCALSQPRFQHHAVAVGRTLALVFCDSRALKDVNVHLPKEVKPDGWDSTASLCTIKLPHSQSAPSPSG